MGHNGDVHADDASDSSTTTGAPRWHVAWLVVAAVVALGPGVGAVLTPYELWPWTNAPMFAHSPVDNARYVIDFTVVDTKGGRRRFDAKAAGYASWHLPRSFLSTAWGADIEGSPWRHVDDDTPELRRARVTTWFRSIVEWNTRKKKKKNDFVDVAFVEVGLTPHHVPGPRRLLGRYELATRRFVYGSEVPSP